MPEGTKDNINQAGIDYYNNLIDALLAAGNVEFSIPALSSSCLYFVANKSFVMLKRFSLVRKPRRTLQTQTVCFLQCW